MTMRRLGAGAAYLAAVLLAFLGVGFIYATILLLVHDGLRGDLLITLVGNGVPMVILFFAAVGAFKLGKKLAHAPDE